MQARFLLGPSGTGKTFKCLAEVRAALLESPEGPPLLFLTPKQATYQLERQLLSDPRLGGFTRLQILSFERLADFVLDEFSASPPQLLSEDGRVMVLRALLARPPASLKLFHATARLRGFAQELSGVFRELRRARVTPQDLAGAAAKAEKADRLDAKLHDLSALYQGYLDWLERRQLEDQDRLLTLAAETLRAEDGGGGMSIRIGAVWLDGFAEMSEQEIDLLMALLPFCDRATLAFNLDREAIGETSWLATWSANAQTYRRLCHRMEGHPGITHSSEWLDRSGSNQRFSQSPPLHHLERHWTSPVAFDAAEETAPASSGAVRIAACANPEAEAVFTARAVLRFARAGGRFREVSVLVRNLERYLEVIRRAFNAYGIPFFLDRREPVGHHPLAELVRSALRIVALRWPPEDWFGALKTGLVHDEASDIDRLENEALARGWKGEFWRRPVSVPDNPELETWAETLRRQWVPPFEQLAQSLGPEPSGRSIASALREFFRQLHVGERLERWSVESANPLHVTFWEQLLDWLDDIALAFADEPMPLREWLSIIDAGLAGQTVGVIPPSLDQVLVGAVDRSRNPDLRMVILLGMNETVFPSPPAVSNLLSDGDRERLAEMGLRIGSSVKDRLSQERYLAYVACTRPRERLLVAYALRDAEDQALNPSPFIAHLRQLFPALEVESIAHPPAAGEVDHASELLPRLLHTLQQPGHDHGSLAPLLQIPVLAGLNADLERFRPVESSAPLSPEIAGMLYGKALRTSVSRIEEFAACPFRFFVTSGLRAEERKLFELDAREKGSFQHEVLALFHKQLADEGRRWRDVTPREARDRIARVASGLIGGYGKGLLAADDESLFTAKSMTGALQDFIETIVAWMDQYEFDPSAVELGFGQEGDPLPAWKLKLDEAHELWFRGKIDRIDLCREADGSTLCTVIDYKSSPKKLDPVLLAHGLQLQLAAYLNVLRGLPEAAVSFGAEKLVPAGAFYVSLRGASGAGKTRREALASADDARKSACRHTGRFDAGWIPKLDRRGAVAGDQFQYSFNQNGALSRKSKEALDGGAFGALLDSVEAHLVRMGRAIFAGDARVDPYRKEATVACDQCEYQAICRIDPWTHEFRVLSKEAPSGEG